MDLTLNLHSAIPECDSRVRDSQLRDFILNNHTASRWLLPEFGQYIHLESETNVMVR